LTRYRTAIIACGTVARVHARAWQGVPDQPVALGALADTHPDARSEFGDFFGIPEDKRSADFRDMLDAERPDFVDVCSWHQQHAEMVIAAAARGPKAILCQKPMAVDLGEADAMLTACERNGVKLVIAYQRPHHATWLTARDLIRQAATGTVRQVQMDDGGNLLNTNSHNIRLALFLLDELRAEWVLGAVERTTDGVERGLPAEDACLGLVGLAAGATILIQGNLVQGLGQGCRVIGSDGVMELDTTHPPDGQVPSDAPMYMPEGPSARYNTESGKVRYLEANTNGWVSVEAPWHDAWAHQCQEAIDWVEGRVAEPISRGSADGRFRKS
jgi:UDP-N-acetyl-2-amino-2-deoxyglucuronate dehydrogenase